jgi:hypothetical protein
LVKNLKHARTQSESKNPEFIQELSDSDDEQSIHTNETTNDSWETYSMEMQSVHSYDHRTFLTEPKLFQKQRAILQKKQRQIPDMTLQRYDRGDFIKRNVVVSLNRHGNDLGSLDRMPDIFMPCLKKRNIE